MKKEITFEDVFDGLQILPSRDETEVKFIDILDKQKEFTGILKDYDKDTVTIELDDETLKTFEKGDIALIRLAFDL